MTVKPFIFTVIWFVKFKLIIYVVLSAVLF